MTTPTYDAATLAKHDAFLAALEEIGHEKRAAEKAGVQLTEIARRARHDDDFNERLKDARALRRIHIRDALFEEGVLGREVVDLAGKVARVRDLKTLHALARKADELDPEKPAVAIQNNVTPANDPVLVAKVEDNRRRLLALLRGASTPQVIEAQVIDVPALPDPDLDLLE
jgi:hypothetical protein